jgi:hypothetical protein
MNDRPLSADMIRIFRNRLLQFASSLTIFRSDPVAVAANAMVLQEWVDAADGPDDKRDRFTALERADDNRDDRREPDNAPEKLIAEAEVFYAFLKAA